MAKNNLLSNSIGSVLNNASQSGAKKRADNIYLIAYENIEINDKNQYEISDINSLKFSIKHNGLKQPLEVMELEKGRYKLLSGERRFTAIKKLIEDKEDGFEKLLDIPCLITNLEENTLPLNVELKEEYAIVMTNKEIRNKDDGTLMFEVRTYSKVFEALKKDEKLAKELEKEGLLISNQKREFVAKNMGMSQSSVQRLENIDKNLIEPLKEKFIAGDLPVTVATNIAKLDEKEQKKIAKKEDIKQADVDKAKEEAEEKAIKKAEQRYFSTTIVNDNNIKFLKNKFEEIEIKFKDNIILKQDEYMKFEKTIKIIYEKLDSLDCIFNKAKKKYK